MAFDTRTLQSRVSRRMFGVFVVCSLLPVLAFSLYAYTHVLNQLEADAAAALGQGAKSAGMSIFERLSIADTQLRMNADRALPPSTVSGRTSAFRRVESRLLDDLSLSSVQKTHLKRPGRTLAAFRWSGTAAIVELFLATADGVLVGELDPVFLFAPERRRTGERYWVEDGHGRLLFAADDDGQSEFVLNADRQLREPFGLDVPAGRELAIVWPQFLKAPFGASEIHVGLSRTEQDIRRPLSEFERTFPIVVGLAVLVAIGLALHQIRRTLVPLDALTDAAEAMTRGDFDARVSLNTHDEFRDLGDAFNRMAAQIASHIAALIRLHEIGTALSGEDGVARVLEKVVRGAAELSGAQACALLLTRKEEHPGSDLVIESAWMDSRPAGSASFDPAGFPKQEARLCVETGESVLVERTSENAPEWEIFEQSLGHPVQTVLAVPLKSDEGMPLGALSVIRSVGCFGEDERLLVESLASQAAISIRRARLVEDLRGLFEGVIELTASAIDEKSAYTGDHCRNVPILTELIADAACRTTEGRLKDFQLSDEERYELRIAALLHDCGKVATPVHVMDKATKLEGILDQIEVVRLRAEIAWRDLWLAELRTEAGSEASATDDFRSKLNDDLDFLELCNIGGEFMHEETKQRVRDISRLYSWRDGAGRSRPLLTDHEVENLCISRGTLNSEEREIINGHVVTTIRLLEELPFPNNLRNVPAIAGAHHEQVDGGGFPLALSGDDLTMQARILGLADVFEALTAKDRPYKPGKTLNQTLEILRRMVDEGKLDPDLHDAFIDQRVYLHYAIEHMAPEQVDDEHRAAIEEETAPWEPLHR
jgi:HD-GYP domain-containing protein (c-di-GMP phosphodiesterase class II)/HAMP domain-containing protein